MLILFGLFILAFACQIALDRILTPHPPSYHTPRSQAERRARYSRLGSQTSPAQPTKKHWTMALLISRDPM